MDVPGTREIESSDNEQASSLDTLATAVIGGLFSSTILTLYLLPAVYAWSRRE